MEILIKSFNRPYYLDRCLQSIYLFAKGFSVIKILDDGTPQKYLDKIQEKYPDVIILKSSAYSEKESFCEKGLQPKNKSIPIDFWIESATNSSDYFLILEDDCWFVEAIDFQKNIEILKSNNCQFLKLFWLGNPKLIQKESERFLKNDKENAIIYKPYLDSNNLQFFKLAYLRFNRFGIIELKKLLKIQSFEKLLTYYSIYSVSSIIFKKEYFLNLWKNHDNSVNEHLQLYNALKFYNKNETVNFAHSESEKIKTGFTSSATSQSKNGVEVDMFQFNLLLNEAWFENDFDSINNFPNDFEQISITSILNKKNSSILPETWSNWSNEFKKQYQNFGCIVA